MWPLGVFETLSCIVQDHLTPMKVVDLCKIRANFLNFSVGKKVLAGQMRRSRGPHPSSGPQYGNPCLRINRTNKR